MAFWNLAFPSFTFASNAALLKRFLGTANSLINARWKLRRLSICVSLPVLVKVAVPQLVMRIAVAHRKRFLTLGFISRRLLSILLQLAPACQDINKPRRH